MCVKTMFALDIRKQSSFLSSFRNDDQVMQLMKLYQDKLM